jgi:hypothetical protein
VPNLAQAWTSAEAAKPPEWHMMGVVRGPRQVDPVIRGDTVGGMGARCER